MASTLHDRFACGELKILVYAAPVDSEEATHHRIVDACPGYP
jgi:hypothetical protein